MIGQQLLTFEELNTFAIEVEAMLNSRPLCSPSADPNDTSALTPAHFLVGRLLTILPEDNFLSVPETRLSIWNFISKARQHFWQHWHLEYLSELQKRQKWQEPRKNLEPGTVVVVMNKKQACSVWPLAVVVEVHPGSDGVARVATIRTAHGHYKRSITLLYPLPTAEEDSCSNSLK